MATDATAADLEPLFDEPPHTLAEAVERLHEAHTGTGQYPDELVAALLELVECGADQIAAYERTRYRAHFRRMSRAGRDLDQGVRNGLQLAARHLDQNLARFRPGDTTA